MEVLLCIESSAELSSVCIAKGNTICSAIQSSRLNAHASELTSLIEQVVRQSGLGYTEISAVGISGGPGSFTGLRVGASAAKGICFALDIPLISIDTLEIIARGAILKEPDAEILIPMIDARRNEVYTAIYADDLKLLKNAHSLILDEASFSEFKTGRVVVVAGNAIEKARQIINFPICRFQYMNAHAELMIKPAYTKFLTGQFEDLARFSPLYLKAPNITKAKEKLKF